MNPYRANAKVTQAVTTGILQRPTKCSRCGAEPGDIVREDGARVPRIQAHHPDYNKPLEVEWLCTACHGKEHAGKRPSKKGMPRSRNFEERGKLVIYMDQRDLNALTARAKLEGRVLIAWARDVLFRAISEVPVEPEKPRRRKRVSLTDAVQSHSVQGEPATSLASVNKKDSIPEAVEHTAKSNRLTCMCASCVEYRRLQQIPLGGLKKKEKTGARD